MSMKDILTRFDVVEKKQTLNESVEECGMPSMGAPEQNDSVSMTLNMSGSGKGGIEDIINILSKIDSDAEGGMDVDDKVDVKIEKKPGMDVMSLADEGWENAPEEEIADASDVIPTGNDLHSKGDEAPAVNGGGNPMQEGDNAAELEAKIKDSDDPHGLIDHLLASGDEAMQQMFDEYAGEYGYHPDDDHDEIINRIVDTIQDPSGEGQPFELEDNTQPQTDYVTNLKQQLLDALKQEMGQSQPVVEKDEIDFDDDEAADMASDDDTDSMVDIDTDDGSEGLDDDDLLKILKLLGGLEDKKSDSKKADALKQKLARDKLGDIEDEKEIGKLSGDDYWDDLLK